MQSLVASCCADIDHLAITSGSSEQQVSWEAVLGSAKQERLSYCYYARKIVSKDVF